jgi:pimeloyl-ACP methyl ester carboxylesterase
MLTIVHRRKGVYLASLTCAAFTCAGCALPGRLQTDNRYAQGVVFILPGIEGRSLLNYNIGMGLSDGGIASAIEVYDWTAPVPGAFLYNLGAVERNRKVASRLAEQIQEYRAEHPGRPVHLIAHSGGAGVAVFTLEALPEEEPIDVAILLAPALSPEYNLTEALRRTRRGIVNFYSPYDVSFLTTGTTVFGATDREHGPAAGAVGFRYPLDLSGPGRALYDGRLRQVRWDPRLRRFGADGSHVGWASRTFSRKYLANLVRQCEAARPLPASQVADAR